VAGCSSGEHCATLSHIPRIRPVVCY
jgi:hypothetical protein